MQRGLCRKHVQWLHNGYTCCGLFKPFNESNLFFFCVHSFVTMLPPSLMYCVTMETPLSLPPSLSLSFSLSLSLSLHT